MGEENINDIVKDEILEYIHNKTPFNYILNLSTIYCPDSMSRSQYFWKNVDEALELYTKHSLTQPSDFQRQFNSLYDITRMIEDGYL